MSKLDMKQDLAYINLKIILVVMCEY